MEEAENRAGEQNEEFHSPELERTLSCIGDGLREGGPVFAAVVNAFGRFSYRVWGENSLGSGGVEESGELWAGYAGARVVVADLSDGCTTTAFAAGMAAARGQAVFCLAKHWSDLPTDFEGTRSLVYSTDPIGLLVLDRRLSAVLGVLHDGEEPSSEARSTD